MKSSSKPLDFFTIFYASIGGQLEMFDFVLFIYLAPIISVIFFPSDNYYINLLNTFLMFAVGYLVRPLGGFLFGYFGDRYGRKKGLVVSLLIMGASTTIIGFIPSYQSIGVLAPIFLFVCRILQGLAIGGDLPGAITYIYEISPDRQKTFYCSIIYFAVNVGILLASGLVFLLSEIMSVNDFNSWGWRIGFMLGIPITVLGCYIRSLLAESPVFIETLKQQKTHKIPPMILLKTKKLILLKSSLFICLFSVVINQLFLYMPAYLETHLNLSKHLALKYNTYSLMVFTISIPIIGLASRHINIKKLNLCGCILFLLLAYPIYQSIASLNFTYMLIAFILIDLLSAIIIATSIPILVEHFDPSLRYSGIGISYNVSFALFGGLTPLICTYLIHAFSHSVGLFINLLIAALITIISILLKSTSVRPQASNSILG